VDGNANIYLAAADGSSPVALSNGPAQEVTPTWSRDGNHIAFAADPDGDFEVFAVNPDGTGVTRLSPGENSDEVGPVWRPASP
jgi:Tol biopolymer transport system component